MSILQEGQHQAEVRSAPQPGDARDREGHAQRPPRQISATRAAQYGSLLLLVAVLLAGLWKPHPLPSLLIPALALAVWWPSIRQGHPERWLFFYVAGIYVYTILRGFANDGGFAIRVAYVIDFDRFIFLGHVPSVSLQRDLFRPWDIGLLD